MEEIKLLSIREKRELYNKLLEGDEEAVNLVISELDRLEFIVRNYESGIFALIEKHKSNCKRNGK